MKFLFVLLLFMISSISYGQTWDEWFHQKKTQIQYLEEQVIALRIYGNYLNEGYNIVQGGLSAVHDIKNGDFNLHNNYFNSLKSVNTAITNNSKTTGIISLQLEILQLNAAINKDLSNSSILSSERMYVKGVLNNILRKCADAITDLTNLTTRRQLEMKDDERIKRINVIYEDMEDKYTFTAHLKGQIDLLALSRQKESSNIQALQSLYNLK